MSHQVRQEEHGALQHSDQEQVPPGVVPRHLGGERAHPVFEVVALDEDLPHVALRHAASVWLARTEPALAAAQAVLPVGPHRVAPGPHATISLMPSAEFKTSLPAPAEKRSLERPPVSLSRPPPPTRASLPLPPLRRSFEGPPASRSLPASPAS